MSARLIKIVAGLLVLTVAFIVMVGLASESRVLRAVVGMTLGLVLLWIVVGGAVMYRLRDPFRTRILNIHLGWKTRFVLFATLLALAEEAITVTMTNLAPAFGVRVGEAYITASDNYLDVVMFHSVVVFVPMFIAWAWLLSRYDFSANSVFLLFGLTGTLAEAISFGGLNQFAMWIFVYGLMVYLPAYTIPRERGARRPHPLHYVIAVILPLLCAVPVAIIIAQLHPVSIHFPPLSAE